MRSHYDEETIDVVVGVEARGFLFAAPLALAMRKPLVPVRKEGKLDSLVKTRFEEVPAIQHI